MSVVMETCTNGGGIAFSSCITSYDSCNGIDLDSTEMAKCSMNINLDMGAGLQNRGEDDALQSTECVSQNASSISSPAVANKDDETVIETECVSQNASSISSPAVANKDDETVIETECVSQKASSISSPVVANKDDETVIETEIIDNNDDIVKLQSRDSCKDDETVDIKSDQVDISGDKTGSDECVHISSSLSHCEPSMVKTTFLHDAVDVDSKESADTVQDCTSNSCLLQNASDDIKQLKLTGNGIHDSNPSSSVNNENKDNKDNLLIQHPARTNDGQCHSEITDNIPSTHSAAIVGQQSRSRSQSLCSTSDSLNSVASSVVTEPSTRLLRSRDTPKSSSQSQVRPVLTLPHKKEHDSDRNSAASTCRPVAKLLQDTGILLASEKVFKYLVEIQQEKVRTNTTKHVDDDKLLNKLESSYCNMASRNVDFAFSPVKRCICGFQSESSNVLYWHQQCGEWNPGRCCMCNGEFTYKRRSQFERHMKVTHKQYAQFIGRPALFSCSNCKTDLSSRALMYQHELVCKKHFVLAKNLMPLPNHEDIPIKPVLVKSSARQQVVVNLSALPPKKPLVSSSVLTRSNSNIVESRPCVPVNTPNGLQAVGKVTAKPLIFASSKQQFVSSGKKHTSISGQMCSVLTKNAPVAVKIPASQNAGYQICPLCSGFVKDDASLEIHMRVVHSLLSTSDVTVCWMCIDRCPVPTTHLLSHIAAKHDVNMLTMLQKRQCSLCPSLPTLRNASAFEHHMVTNHCKLFVSTEALWQVIEKLSPRRSHVKHSPDGTLLCQKCSSSFISRAFLCRHSYLVHQHGESTCTCDECRDAGTIADASLPTAKSRSAAAAMVVISDDEDEVVASKKLKLSTSSDEERSLRSLLNRNGSIMDKIEEVLEIDGETVVIVQECDYDDD